uniref:Phospholipid/glycerol acyltransferase domain-containing protein n=1 Tax=Chromera velia CCMP2878 TaxID=1169474 RepID=A0A0G4HBF9_9ALVE|eukprot:Cvel_25823.t1-p1 / transcript=Cvel_25823.t1 / gene=Cvel_25823 / organism=Chromera_velia_CCMP2878 / gene_product=hypothetical protein / transcript_product=hypothetical protein / location=Cvel_scaffold2978:16003-18800(+) / protein_length=349 / sequence_SO=supercontig / SO=protein_coding / is_pseudo=false
MEKYRQFADETTGVHPFVPVWVNHRISTVGLISNVVMGPVAILRLVLLSVPLLLLWIAFLLTSLIPVGAVRQPLRRLLYGSFCRLALVLLGYLHIPEAQADFRRLRIRPPSREYSRGPLGHAGHGSLVLCNFTSVVDVVYLTRRVAPLFAVAHGDGSISLLSPLSMMQRSLKFVGPMTGKGQYPHLAAACDAALASSLGPVVFFPEGGKSNGTCVLEWDAKAMAPKDKKGAEALGEILKKRTWLAGIAHPRQGAYSGPHTVFGGAFHLFLLSLRVYNYMKVDVVAPADVGGSLKDKEGLQDMGAQCRTLIGRAMGGTLVATTASRALEFEKYWRETYKKKRYVQKKKGA